jgi:tyrosyl-tRNA synthetase
MSADFLSELRWRGLLQDVTPELEHALKAGRVRGYIGFDPTAPSLTIGNLVQIMLLRRFQAFGHQPIVVMGGATGLIGDPSGKNEERKLLSLEVLRTNIESQTAQMHKLLHFGDGESAAIMVNNYDFYNNLNVLVFLRDVGKHLSINYMMAKDSVKNRLESGISFTEFSYQLLQAYDYHCLYNQYQCTLQMGGSDQWGNILGGVELIRRMSGGEAHALTTTLLTKPDGTKYGKTEAGNVWLDAEMTSPYEFYQFFLNSTDGMMPRLMRTFSMMSQSEIQDIEARHSQAPHERLAQKTLAAELTITIHGATAYEAVKRVSEILFNKQASRTQLEQLTETDWQAIAHEVTAPTLPAHQMTSPDGIPIIELLAKTEICKSNGEARRALQANAISINKIKITNPDHKVPPTELCLGKYLLVENGQKNKFVVQFN